MRTFLFTVILISLIITRLAGLSAGPLQTQNHHNFADTTSTKLFIVRHAERDAGIDPPLNKTGNARAQALLNWLADSGITAIYCPNFVRNTQTAKPLADSLGIPIQILPDTLKEDGNALAAHFLKMIKEHRGQTILFIGNQSSSIEGYLGNITAIFLQLNAPEIPLTRYFDFHIILIYPDGRTHFQHGVYGSLHSTKIDSIQN
jgi:phosphohistidine phosphatase SixA